MAEILPSSYQDNFGSINSSKLINTYLNDNGYLSIFTELDTHIKVGDVVYITSTNTTSILDNITSSQYTSNFPYNKYTQGYKVLYVDVNKNQITIDKLFAEIVSTLSLENHYITKVKGEFGIIGNTGTSMLIMDSSVWKDIILQNAEVEQAIFLDGEISNTTFKSKYGPNYKTLKQDYQSSGLITSNNNYSYGYNYYFGNSSTTLYYINVENGNFYDVILYGNGTNIISGGYFENCIIDGDYIVSGGYFKHCIFCSSCTWNGGTWEDVNSGSTNFLSKDWFGGTWNQGLFSGKTWYDGIFNNGEFIESTWNKGRFNGGIFTSSTWIDGFFDNGIFINSGWKIGTFNTGDFLLSNWSGGTFNEGNIYGSTIWIGGNFYNGYFTNSTWYDGNFYNGVFSASTWHKGNFYNGLFTNSNWIDGSFYQQYDNIGSLFVSSVWTGGTFYNGTFENSVWYGGDWKRGNFESSTWFGGTWNGGTWNGGSVYNDLYWKDGTWNYGSLDPQATVSWSGGTFNRGVFVARELWDISNNSSSRFDFECNSIKNTKNTTIAWKNRYNFTWLSHEAPQLGALYSDGGIDLKLTGNTTMSYYQDYFGKASVGYVCSGASGVNGNYQYLSRIYLWYDTSSIPDSAIINSVSLFTYNFRTVEGAGLINIMYDPYTGTSIRNLNVDWLRSPSLNTGSDFSSKALSASTLLSDGNKISGITVSDNINLDPNSINKNGYTRLCVMNQKIDFESNNDISTLLISDWVSFNIQTGEPFELSVNYSISGSTFGYNVAPVSGLGSLCAITYSIIDEYVIDGGTKYNSTNEIIILSANNDLTNIIRQHEKISLYSLTNFVYNGSGITMLNQSESFGLYNYKIIIPKNIQTEEFLGISEVDNLMNMDYRDVISFNVSSTQFSNIEFQVTSTFSDDNNIYFNLTDTTNYSNSFNVGLNILYKNRNNPYRGYHYLSEYYMDFKIINTEYIFISGSTYNQKPWNPTTFTPIGKWYTKITLDKEIMWLSEWWKGSVSNGLYPNGTLPNLLSDYFVDTKNFSWYDGNFYNNNFEGYWYGGYFQNGQWNGYNVVTNSYDKPSASFNNNRKRSDFRRI